MGEVVEGFVLVEWVGFEVVGAGVRGLRGENGEGGMERNEGLKGVGWMVRAVWCGIVPDLVLCSLETIWGGSITAVKAEVQNGCGLLPKSSCFYREMYPDVSEMTQPKLFCRRLQFVKAVTWQRE